MSNLRISLVSSLSSNLFDDKLKTVFSKLIDYVKAENKDFDFTGIEMLKLSYESDSYALSKNCIASLTPSKFLACKEVLQDKITPILSVKKNHQNLPYFPAFFIANKDSGIRRFDSDKIKRIFLVSVDSTSGYIAPLYKLWEAGIISTPNEQGIREKGWEMILVGNQRDIEEEVVADKQAIGATGQFQYQDDPGKCLVKPILRYDNLPQDVIVLSSNLQSFREPVIKWFQSIFETDESGYYVHEEGLIVSESSTRISDVCRIDTEFENALLDLKRMIGHVKTVPITKSKSTLKTYKVFLASSEELKTDRDGFEIFMSRENNEFVKEGFYFEVIRWENFVDSMSQAGLQREYNKAIADCDIFISLFWTKVGKYTEEEFEVAFGKFKETNKPLIFTYFKDAPIPAESITYNIVSLLKFREKLEELKHYRTVYKDISDLQYQFKMQLEKFLKQ